ncbi:conserved hypothetical protein [Crenothrix polyspora]|uniref:Uncharacterized protein n=1 Tax=Crenothrix polyspora TaxID=360316 RepID=A0A1R4HDY1_9GAMM|nr:hypothetical protein [Crenothrix polyspora]SJM94455.1 conserved hypothetical protein [Crenothrix polyspora]
MSFKSSLIKTAIKLTPNALIAWGANIVLKGIVELSEFSFDLDARTVYVQARLYGEEDIIEVSLQNFAVINDEGTYKFILQQAQSNRPWLDNLLSRIVGKAWKIPMIEPIKSQIGQLFPFMV